MSQKIVVEMTDDIDGSTGDDVRTVSFSFEGVDYTIDLSQSNHDAMVEALAEFVEHATRVGGRRKPATATGRPAAVGGSSRRSKEELQAIRRWAWNNEDEYNWTNSLKERGRIPQEVLDAYDEAHKPTGKKVRVAAARRR